MEEHRLNEESDEMVMVLGRLPKITVTATSILIGIFHSPSQSIEENSWLAALLI
jgi:hypothetical protein